MRARNAAKLRSRIPPRVDGPEPPPTGVVLTEEKLARMDGFVGVWRSWTSAHNDRLRVQREWAVASEVEFEAARVLQETLADCEAAGVMVVRDHLPLPDFPPVIDGEAEASPSSPSHSSPFLAAPVLQPAPFASTTTPTLPGAGDAAGPSVGDHTEVTGGPLETR